MIDQLLGWLVTHAGVNVTLVEVQLMAQGLPWMQLKSKRRARCALRSEAVDAVAVYVLTRCSDGTRALLRRSCAPCAVPAAPSPTSTARRPNSWIADGSPSVATYRVDVLHDGPRYEGTDATKVCDARRATTRRRQRRELRAHHAAAARRVTAATTRRRRRNSRSACRWLLLGDRRRPYQRGAAAAGAPTTSAQGLLPNRRAPARGDDRGCAAACRACDACRYISFSPAYLHRECAWYRTCDLHRLSHIGSEVCPTYVSARVPRERYAPCGSGRTLFSKTFLTGPSSTSAIISISTGVARQHRRADRAPACVPRSAKPRPSGRSTR